MPIPIPLLNKLKTNLIGVNTTTKQYSYNNIPYPTLHYKIDAL